MTCGSFMKWDMWECFVARNPSRKNVFSFETQGKTSAGFKPLAGFQTHIHCWRSCGRGLQESTLSGSRLGNTTRIVDLKLFIPEGIFRRESYKGSPPKALTTLFVRL